MRGSLDAASSSGSPCPGSGDVARGGDPGRPRRHAAAAAEMDRLYPDVEIHTAEEARRFGLVEEHWNAWWWGWSEGL